MAREIQNAIAVDSPPSGLVSPPTPEALARVLQQCDRHAWPMLTCGLGSKLSWGGLAPKPIALVVSTQRLNRIIEHALGDLTVTVEAGVKLADLQNALAPTGQFLPLNPAYPETTTIGGLIATADSWRQRYGGVRDLVLGISFVRADGQIAKAGGRVVKNVAGYDLMKLFAGSYGTLGIISQVTFRTYPLPPASGTIVLTGTSSDIAQAAQNLIASSLAPVAADLLSTNVVRRLALGDGMGLIACCQSIPESVQEQLAQLETMGKQFGLQSHFYRETDEIQLWKQLQQLLRVPASPEAIACKIGVAPTAAVDFCDRLDALTLQQGLGVVHLGVGLGRLHLEGENELARVQQLRAYCQQHQGFLTLLEAPPTLKQKLDPWGYTGNALEFMRKIKEQFDPKNLLNPGRFVGGI
jgi:glycolate oxidase FAD binding subunit